MQAHGFGDPAAAFGATFSQLQKATLDPGNNLWNDPVRPSLSWGLELAGARFWRPGCCIWSYFLIASESDVRHRQPSVIGTSLLGHCRLQHCQCCWSSWPSGWRRKMPFSLFRRAMISSFVSSCSFNLSSSPDAWHRAKKMLSKSSRSFRFRIHLTQFGFSNFQLLCSIIVG